MPRVITPSDSPEQRIVSISDYLNRNVGEVYDFFCETASYYPGGNFSDNLPDWTDEELAAGAYRFRSRLSGDDVMGILMHLQSALYLCEDQDGFVTVSQRLIPNLVSIDGDFRALTDAYSPTELPRESLLSIANRMVAILLLLNQFLSVIYSAYSDFIDRGCHGNNPSYDPLSGRNVTLSAEGEGHAELSVQAASLDEAVSKVSILAESEPDRFEMNYEMSTPGASIFQNAIAVASSQQKTFTFLVARHDTLHYAAHVEGVREEQAAFEQVAGQVRNGDLEPLVTTRSFRVIGIV